MRNPFQHAEADLMPRTLPHFSASPDAQQLRAVIALLQRGGQPPEGLNEEMDRLSDVVTRDIRNGKFVMNYTPPRDGSVTLPVTDDAMYLQAVMYWCSRLDASIPRLTEACARTGDNASVREVQKTVRQIEMESQTSRTTTLFIEPGQH